MGLGSPRIIAGQDFRVNSSTKQETIGAYAETPDGRGYRYSLAGGVALSPGKICVAATVDTNVTNVTVAATAAIGATKVTLDAGGAITADTYQDGYLTVNDATGEGASYLVRNHPATTGAAELTVNLVDPIKVALVTDTSEVTLTANPWSGVLISIADQLDMGVGVPNNTITAAYYGWLQTKGVCSVLADETIAIGQNVAIGSSTVGAVECADASGEQVLGVAIVAGVDTEYREIYLTID